MCSGGRTIEHFYFCRNIHCSMSGCLPQFCVIGWCIDMYDKFDFRPFATCMGEESTVPKGSMWRWFCICVRLRWLCLCKNSLISRAHTSLNWKSERISLVNSDGIEFHASFPVFTLRWANNGRMLDNGPNIRTNGPNPHRPFGIPHNLHSFASFELTLFTRIFPVNLCSSHRQAPGQRDTKNLSSSVACGR